MRIVVSGGTGFIGSFLVPALADEGHEVVALARRPEAAAVREGVTVVSCDLTEPLRLPVETADAVVHLAQANVSLPEGARELFAVNTAATHELLDWARSHGAERFVLASSGSIYGLGDGVVDEDSPRRATDLYAVTKRCAEQLVESYAPHFAGTAVLRLFAPYGPTQTARLIPNLLQRVREGLPVTLNDGGRPRLTPLFVEDVVRAFVAGLDLDGHSVVNVAGDEVVSIRELALLIGEVLGRDPVFANGGAADGDLIGDNRRMHELLGLEALVPLEEGLRATALAGAAA